jgi:hypothetical protein
MTRQINFPYKIYKGAAYPIIKILAKGPDGPVETEAYVDSGASISIFLATVAYEMGLDFTKGKLKHIMVGDGSFIPVYLHRIPIRLDNAWLRTTIGFSSHLGADFNLLGQKDIFDRFAITFDKRNNRISFRPY